MLTKEMQKAAKCRLTAYLTDLDLDQEELEKVQEGEVIWVLRDSGTDILCRKTLEEKPSPKLAALWVKTVIEANKDADIYTFEIGGPLRKINRQEAFEILSRWVFEIVGK